MFSTILSAAPRIGMISFPGDVAAAGSDFFAGAVAAVLPSPLCLVCSTVFAGAWVADAAGWPFPSSSSKYARHDSSTSEGSLRKRASSDST
jgi:hypothetical protein